MEIKRIGTQPSAKGPAEWLTGTVRIDPFFEAPDPAFVEGASVTFEPGARTAWHTHPLGQTLIVTAAAGHSAGEARLRKFGRPTWSGSRPAKSTGMVPAPTTAMTHIAIQERKDGKVVDWMEHVTDEQSRPAK
jgi:hypothetical protein